MFKHIFKIPFIVVAATAVVLLTLSTAPSKSGTIGTLKPAGVCEHPKAEEYIKANKPDLTLNTEEDQKRFHTLLVGKPSQGRYDKVMFYPAKGGNPVVEVVLIRDGCIVGVGRIHKKIYFSVKEKFLGKVM